MQTRGDEREHARAKVGEHTGGWAHLIFAPRTAGIASSWSFVPFASQIAAKS